MSPAIRLLALVVLVAAPLPAAAAESQLLVWAWERPEDLRFLPAGVEVAAETGFVELAGDKVLARARRFPLRMKGEPSTAVVHVQIDRRGPLAWTAAQRAAAARAVLTLGGETWARTLQIDFEVRRSEHQILMDLLADVRAGLPRGVRLSMTAIASWCETETWLADAPVDEIAPMLFRMGPRGEAVKAALAAGGDFDRPECRKALAVSVDTPLQRAPAGRKVYLFSPRSWRASDFDRARKGIAAWASQGG
jgi:hypothetical protein